MYLNTNLDNTSIESRIISFTVMDSTEVSNLLTREMLIDDVKPEPDFVTAFTPNGDGVNDVWEIRKISAYQNVRVYIYNSEGILVFESEDYAKPWDGTSNGSRLPGDAYYYKVILNNGEREYEGTVNILR